MTDKSPEIEVTAEMIDAGTEYLRSYPWHDFGPGEARSVAEEIISRALAAARKRTLPDEGTPMTKTLAEELREDAELLRRRFIHATRPRGPLTMEQAAELCRRMDGIGEQKVEQNP